MNQSATLTLREFCLQLAECGIVSQSVRNPPEEVVIRTETGDHGVAAIHREGTRLVLDLGQPIKE